MNALITAISSNKGGVAKTISTVNLAASLTLQGYKTLIVDLDQQANATQYLDCYGQSHTTINDVLCANKSVSEAIVKTKWTDLFLVPSHKSFSNAAIVLRSDEFGVPQDRLRVALEALKSEFDCILIDCPPSLDIVTANAYRAASSVIVPLTPSEFALEGLSSVFDAVDRAGRGMGARAPRILGGLATRVSAHLRIVQHNIDQLRLLGIPTFQAQIRQSTKVVESETQKVPLVFYAPKATAAIDYFNFATEYAGAVGLSQQKVMII